MPGFIYSTGVYQDLKFFDFFSLLEINKEPAAFEGGKIMPTNQYKIKITKFGERYINLLKTKIYLEELENQIKIILKEQWQLDIPFLKIIKEFEDKELRPDELKSLKNAKEKIILYLDY